MTTSYIEWIDQQILKYQKEIAKLTVARDVIKSIPSRDLPAQKKPVKLLAAPKPVKARSPGRKYSYEVRAALANSADGLTSADVINALGFTQQIDKQAVYNALSWMSINGVITRDENTRIFRIARPAKPTQDEQAA